MQDHKLENRMESFFLAETTKYLYLLFDTDNFIHNTGNKGTLIETPNGECIIDTGAYIFNTEAHPMDIAAVHCCSAGKKEADKTIQEMHDHMDLLSLIGINFEEEILGTWDKNDEPKSGTRSKDNIFLKFKHDNAKLEEVIENVAMELELSNSDGGDIMLEEGADDSDDEEIDYPNENDEDIDGVVGSEEKTAQKQIHGEIIDNSELFQSQISPKQDDKTILPTNTNIKTEHSTQPAKNYKILGPQIQKLFGMLMGSDSSSATAKRKPSVKHLYQTLQNFSLHEGNYPQNLTCRAQPYHMRLSAMGEMFMNNIS